MFDKIFQIDKTLALVSISAQFSRLCKNLGHIEWRQDQAALHVTYFIYYALHIFYVFTTYQIPEITSLVFHAKKYERENLRSFKRRKWIFKYHGHRFNETCKNT